MLGSKVGTPATRRAQDGRDRMVRGTGRRISEPLLAPLRCPGRTQPQPASAAVLPPSPLPRHPPSSPRQAQAPPPKPTRGQGLVRQEPQGLARFRDWPGWRRLPSPRLLLHHPRRSPALSLPTPPPPPLPRAHGRAPDLPRPFPGPTRPAGS